MTDEHQFRAGDAPTPFSASEIRNGCPEGRRVMIEYDEAGEITYLSTSFENCDDSAADFVNQPVDHDGKPTGDEQRFRAAWSDLQGHASFPDGVTSISRQSLTTPAGQFDCLLYTVTDGNDIKQLWFAVDRPGLPLATRETTGGEEVRRSTVISDTIVHAPPDQAENPHSP